MISQVVISKKHWAPTTSVLVGEVRQTDTGASVVSGRLAPNAVWLDEQPKVRFWVRNVDRKPNAFWLQLSGARFYPDFVAMLTDGRILVVEYKGAFLADGAKEKRMVGELWAEASGGQCLFAMPSDTGFRDLSAVLARPVHI